MFDNNKYNGVLARSQIGPIQDRGGMVISCPVSYFNGNNYTGWKSYFQHTARAHIVAIVEYTNFETKRHEVLQLGAPSNPADIFSITHEVYVKYRRLWEEHGARMIPSYELKSVYDPDEDPFNFRADKPPKKAAKRTRGVRMCFRIHDTLRQFGMFLCALIVVLVL